jgi:hypothetical protein
MTINANNSQCGRRPDFCPPWIVFESWKPTFPAGQKCCGVLSSALLRDGRNAARRDAIRLPAWKSRAVQDLFPVSKFFDHFQLYDFSVQLCQ